MNFPSCKEYICFRGKISSWWYSGRRLCLNFAFAIARIALFCKTSIFLTSHLNEDPHAIMP